MKIVKLTLLVLAALSSGTTLAQQVIVAASPENSTTLELYPAPDASLLPRQVKVSEAGLPLPVQARQGGFLKVDVAGQPYWIRSAKVRVSRSTTANCGALASATMRHGPTSSTPGASDDVCSKSN